ncbi:hypothetical protein M0R45_030498 [Rubus argutus]|uniref:Uncharacterized protein n=1 Tax=Rubus argutus TaxID=59490 RepID=A0AAW1WB69_RUBAR
MQEKKTMLRWLWRRRRSRQGWSIRRSQLGCCRELMGTASELVRARADEASTGSESGITARPIDWVVWNWKLQQRW